MSHPMEDAVAEQRAEALLTEVGKRAEKLRVAIDRLRQRVRELDGALLTVVDSLRKILEASDA